MALQVIGTGMGRTGTHSLKQALEILGFGPCYHMEMLFHHPEDLQYFLAAQKGDHSQWDQLFDGYKSAVDFPIIQFYPELVKLYPEAKIIHTLRDPQSWLKSYKSTILEVGKPSLGTMVKTALRMPFNPLLRQRMKVAMYNGKYGAKFIGGKYDDDSLLAFYDKWNRDAQASLPPHRTLFYRTGDGWGPLCTFLGVPVPAVPYPQSNSTEMFLHNARNMHKKNPFIYQAGRGA